MQNIAVVYYSGYGHTKLVAEKVAQGAHADLISIDNEGNITEQEWEKTGRSRCHYLRCSHLYGRCAMAIQEIC